MNTKPRIACLGWGSLTWNHRELPVVGGWQDEGPLLPVEFARESSDGRITLVICEGAAPVPTQWALLDVADFQAAITALARREGITKRVATDIGFVNAMNGQSFGASVSAIVAWSRTHDFDGVVWTNLPCGFKASRSVMPSGEEVLSHLRGLDAAGLRAAREYVERAPHAVDTAYRRLIERSFGWTQPKR